MYPNSLEPDMRETLQVAETWPLETPRGRTALPATAAMWIDLIDHAQSTIDIASFYAITEDGEALEPVLMALERARTRGIIVRFLFDDIFYRQMPELPDQLTKLGYLVRRLNIKRVTEHGGVMHAKYMLVDSRAGCLGSANFDWRSLSHIQELSLRFDDPGLAGGLTAIFASDWARAGDDPLPHQEPISPSFPLIHAGQHHRARLLASPPDMLPAGIAWELPELVEAIASAQSKVRIQLLSFHTTDRDSNPFPTLANALREAAVRGVRVELMVADWNAEPGEVEPLIELSRTHGLHIKLTHIPPHSSGFIAFARVAHSKFMTVDDHLTWVGTSNWGGDYFNNSRNIGVMVEGRALVTTLAGVFDSLWASDLAQTVRPGGTYAAPHFREPPPGP